MPCSPSPCAWPGRSCPRAGRQAWSPFTLEPAESYTQEELDEFAAVLERVADEAYSDPETVKTAPHRSTAAAPVPRAEEHPAMTWRAFQELRRQGLV